MGLGVETRSMRFQSPFCGPVPSSEALAYLSIICDYPELLSSPKINKGKFICCSWLGSQSNCGDVLGLALWYGQTQDACDG